jgi:hypothetical protein
MVEQVFISYASDDEQMARQLRAALNMEDIRVWWAPDSINAGDRFAERIATDLPLCKVFVLLWSKHAAQSPYVKRELDLAAGCGIAILPILLDEQPRENFYTRGIAWRRFEELKISGIVREVQKRLRLLDLPYPLHDLYWKTIQSQPDLALDLEALRMAIRFVTLLFVAKYAGLGKHSDELNGRIEAALETSSLFADLDAARQTAEWLDDHGKPLHQEWNQFFQRFSPDVPTLADFESDDNEYAAGEFDRRNLPRLLDLAGGRHQESQLSDAIRGLLKEVLSVKWLASGRLTIRGGSAADAGQQVTAPIPVTTGSGDRRLYWESGPEPIEATPFICLMRAGTAFAAAVLRQNSGEAVYSTLSPREKAQESRERLVMPWGSLVIVRQAPKPVYIGESHKILLLLTNNSPEPVTIPRLVDRLPDNLAAENGSSSVEVAANIELGAGEARILEYLVVGGGVPGSRRSFQSEKTAYLFRGEENFAAIKGESEIVVRVLPAPQLVVERRLEDLTPAEDHTTVALDAIVTVQVEIRSAGGPIPNIRLKETFEGCELLEGSAVLHEGSIARLDLQKPILVSYRIRPTSTDGAIIRLLATDSTAPIEGGELRLQVRDMPPPHIEQRWQNVSRTSRQELRAELRIDNTGGTSANRLHMTAQVPGNVQAFLTAPDFGRLEPGDTLIVLLPVKWIGIPSGNLAFRLSYCDARGIENTLNFRLDLNRVIEGNVVSLRVGGRKNERAEIVNALTEPGVVLLNLHGVRGSGRRWLLRSEIDRLQRGEGRQIALFEVDCRRDNSFAESVFRLFEDIVYRKASLGERGKDSVFLDFLRSADMDEREYPAPVSNLRGLMAHQRPESGTWYALALLLPKLAKACGYQPLVLLFHEVSRFALAELDGLSTLCKHLQKSPGVRIAVTSHTPLKLEEIDRSIAIGLLDDEDCRELIGRVFILPKASAELEQALIEKSEHLPVNLVSLLQHVVEDSGTLIDFDSPAGARIKDAAAFSRIPTSLLQSELKSAQAAGVPEAILACLSALREPVTEAQLMKYLDRLDAGISAEQLHQGLKACEARQWLRVSGKKYEVVSATIREALRRAASAEQYELANQALFTCGEEGQRADAKCFDYLVECPGDFLKKREAQLAAGLRGLVASSSFSHVRVVLDRLRTLNITSADSNPDLAVIEHELQWAETGDLDEEKAEALLQKLRKSAHAHTAMVRLSLLLSQWYGSRAEDYRKAADVAEACGQSWGPFKHFHVDDPELELEFQLNLWAVYYHLLDEEKFKRADAQIWKRVLAKRNGEHDSNAIARFLGLFLEFQHEFANLDERLEHFPRAWTKTLNEERPVRDNAIEVLTRTERLSGTELEGFLLHPDKLNQNNAQVLGKLYLDLGSSLWTQSETRRRLEEQSGERTAKDDEAESYVKRAEALFAGRFRLEAAHARAALGHIYADKMRLAENSHNTIRVKEASSEASRWLQMAVAEFEMVDAREEAMGALAEYADVERIWVRYQPDRLEDAIRAYEKLISLEEIDSGRMAEHNVWRRALANLYQDAGRFGEASAILSSVKEQTVEMEQQRAILNSARLHAGEVAINKGNYKDFQQDLENLRKLPAPDRAPVVMIGGQIRTAADAAALISWKLVLFLTEQQESIEALRSLRGSPGELYGWPPLAAELAQQLPDLLFRLWQMEGSEDDQMTLDFSNLILPLMAPETKLAIDRLLESVWEWEGRRRGLVHVAAADMSLVLCEWYLERSRERGQLEPADMDVERKLAADVFARLVRRSRWETASATRIVARAVTIVMRCGAARRDESVIHTDLAPLIENLKSQQLFNVALQIMVNLVEMLLDVHMSTQDAWYYGAISKLADQLRPLQEQSESKFDEVTHLISVYLQLPTGITDAVDLMEKQCKQLLAEKDYELLPNYLSFLSDLLSNALQRDAYLMRLLTIVEQGDPSAIERVTASESQRSTRVRQVATQLCGDIIAALRTQRLGRTSSRHVLYNAAKLLPERETADLKVAIYTKLYEAADRREGSCVWGAHGSWVGSPGRAASIGLADMVALTTYANIDEECADGRVRIHHGVIQGSARNYLITSQTRNHLLLRQARVSSGRDLQTIYACLELERLLFLRNFIASIPHFLRDFDEFERMAWVTFLHDYLFSTGEGAPFWQKRQKIENHRKELDIEIEQLTESLSRVGLLLRGAANTEQIQQQIAPRVVPFLSANVKRGRDLMIELADRMQMFSLEDVLGEVQRQLADEERALDFGSILRLWKSEGSRLVDADAGDSEDAFFETDPVKLIGWATQSGLRLMFQGEAALAEKIYRFAVKLCDVHGMAETREYDAALRGLFSTLEVQSKHVEAQELGDRLLQTLEARSAPQVGAFLEEMADMLKKGDRNEEALAYLVRRVEWERRQPTASRQLMEALRNDVSMLWKLERWGESELLLRELTELDAAEPDASGAEPAFDFYNYALVLVHQGKHEEAFVAIERAWYFETDPESVAAARKLFVRASVALLLDRDAATYIGQVKAMLTSGAFQDFAATGVDWDHSSVVEAVNAHATPEMSALMRAVAHAIEDPQKIANLERIPEWVHQTPVAAEPPRADQSFGTGA